MADNTTAEQTPTAEDDNNKSAAEAMDVDPTTNEQPPTEDDNNKSALQANIDSKGKNAYYFAHAHKSTGPKWDGKPEPKLLGKQESALQEETKKPAFDVHKSTIRKYAFLDEKKCVKLYIDLPEVGEKCTDEDVVLDFTETSMNLVVNNYNKDEQDAEPLCLCFRKLTAPIDNATCKRKKDKLIVTLTKTKEGTWHTINDKGTPDHEVV